MIKTFDDDDETTPPYDPPKKVEIGPSYQNLRGLTVFKSSATTIFMGIISFASLALMTIF